MGTIVLGHTPESDETGKIESDDAIMVDPDKIRERRHMIAMNEAESARRKKAQELEEEKAELEEAKKVVQERKRRRVKK